MSYDNECTNELPTKLSDFSIDSDQWEILKPISETSSNPVKMIGEILTIETVSAAIFSVVES
tara:strand:- start:396 stop:581 length:186 start_codon:yes stop_codon:yes gene_type:complete